MLKIPLLVKITLLIVFGSVFFGLIVSFVHAEVIEFDWDTPATGSNYPSMPINSWQTGNQTFGTLCSSNVLSEPNAICFTSASAEDWVYYSFNESATMGEYEAQIYISTVTESSPPFNNDKGIGGIGLVTSFGKSLNIVATTYGDVVITDPGLTAPSEWIDVLTVGWNHFYIEWNGTSTQVYINGVPSGLINIADVPTGIIMNSWIGTAGYAGRLDNLTAYTNGDIPPPPSPLNTQITTINSPSIGINTVTSSTSVDFDIDYVSNSPTPSRICVELVNNFQSLNPLCEDIYQSGMLNFSTSTELVYGYQYQWNVTIYGDNNTIIDRKGTYVFSVVTPQQSIYIPGTGGYPFQTIGIATTSSTSLSETTMECDPNSDFFRRSVCNLAILLFVPSTASVQQLQSNIDHLMNVLPFSIFSEFVEATRLGIIDNHVDNTTLTLVLYGENIEIISPESLNTVAGENSTSGLRYLMAISLWIGFAWYGFSRIKGLL